MGENFKDWKIEKKSKNQKSRKTGSWWLVARHSPQ